MQKLIARGLRLLLLLTVLATGIPKSQAAVVYFDNSVTNWSTPHAYVWTEGGTNNSWPGEAMTKVDGYDNLWTFDTGSHPNVIFNSGTSSGSIQTSDLTAVDGMVYRMTANINQASSVTWDSIEKWKENPNNGEEEEIPVTIVYYDNTVTQWSQPKAYVYNPTGSSWPGDDMMKVSGYENLWSFDAGKSKNIIFNNGGNSQTKDLDVVNGLVYRMLGTASQSDHRSWESVEKWEEFINNENPDDPIIPDNNQTFWLEPEKPTINESVTIHYNAAKGNAAVRGKDLYLHLGLAVEDNDQKKVWKDVLTDWNNLEDKYKMVKDSNDPDHYYYEISPSIKEFFNLSDDLDVSYVAFIVRDRNGNKAQTDDVFIPIINPVSASTPVGAYISHEIAGGSIVVTGEDGTLTITPYSDYIAKVFTLPNTLSTATERKSITIYEQPQNLTLEVIEDTEDELVVSWGAKTIKAHINKSNSTVAFSDVNGNAILAEDTNLDNRAGRRGVKFQAMHDAGFYGGGYNGQRTNWDSKSMVMDNTQTGGWTTSTSAPHNICIPFVVSTGGYGILFDDHYRGATITPSANNGTTYSTGSQDPIAYYFVGGGSMDKVVENYTWLTGRQQMPPYWALGYITSRYVYHSFNEADNIISGIKNAGIPLDGIVFDIFWQGADESGMGNLDWYSNNFPNPASWMQNKKDQGVHTIVITEPFFTNRSSNYSTLESNGYLADEDVNDMAWLRSDRVGLIDASNPDAMNWMFENGYKPRTQEGVDGMWLDLGEPERHDADSHHQGGTVSQVHNEFGNLWVESVYNGLRHDFPNLRPMLMPRAGTSGMQRFSTMPWTGDIRRSWDGLEAQVPALVSSAMSGVSFMTSDIGGFIANGYTNAELYLRWVEEAVFTANIRTHSSDLPEPTNSCYDSVRNDVRRFINKHYNYLPYTYTLAWFNTSKGTPMPRPVNMYDANPQTLANVKDEYLWGRDILVAPVLTNTTQRSIKFPDGKWLDLNNYKDLYNGGTTTTYNAPLDVLPHFGRVGSFIPRYTQETFTNTKDLSHSDYTIDFIVDPDNVSEGYLFNDDRTTPSDNIDYKYHLTKFQGEVDDDRLIIYIWRYDHEDGGNYEESREIVNGYDDMPENHNYTFAIHNWSGASRALASLRVRSPRVNYDISENLTNVSSLDELNNAAGNAYFLDSDNNKAYVKATVPNSGSHVIELNNSGAVITGLEEVASAASLSIAYANGLLNYSIAPEMTGGLIEVFTAAGVEIFATSADDNDGTVHQIPLSLESGLYIARISASDAKGNRMDKIAKIAVK